MNRPRSWDIEAPAGSFATVIAWHSGQSWFDALMDALATNAGENTRRAAKVSRGTLLMIARADWLSADTDTGRGVTTAHETVAAQLGMSAKTVQRARKILEELGFAVTVVRGRYLTRTERQAAKAAHGGRQLRAASVRALTLPRPARSVENVHLPRRGVDTLLTHPLEKSPMRANARKKAAPRPRPRKTHQESDSSRSPRGLPRPLGIQRLAGELVRRVRWLDTGKHLGALCDVIESTGIDVGKWRAGDLIEVLNSFFRERQMDYPTRMRNPLGFLRWVLSLAIDPTSPPPAERRARMEAERKSRQDQYAQEREQERRRVAAIDHAEVARIIAASNADIAERQRAARHLDAR